MKNTSHIFLLIVLIASLLSSCSPSSNIPEIEIINTPINTPVPTDTPKPKVSCPQEEVDAYLDEIDLIMEEWDDTVLRAGSTSRMSLSPVIGELQDIKRNLRRVDRPECANYINDV